MSRGDGFEISDTDTGMMADPKILALARRLRSSVQTLAAVALYDAVRLASWKAGCRLTLEETLPGWCIDPIDDLTGHLVAVGLLDGEHRIPAHAWAGWFGPAYERRQAADFPRIVGGLVAHGMGRDEAITEAKRRTTEARTRLIAPAYNPASVRPSVRPTDRPIAVDGSKEPETTKRNGKEEGVSPNVLASMTPEERAVYDRLMGGRP